MTGTDLLEALSFVDEKYIQEAENARLSAKIPWIKVLSVAACLCILITGALALERMTDKFAETEAAAPAIPESAATLEEPAAAAPKEEAGTPLMPEEAFSESVAEPEAPIPFDKEVASGELLQIPYAKLRVVTILEDGSFEAIAEATQEMEVDTQVTVVVDPSKVPGAEGTMVDTIGVAEGALVEIYDGAYDASQNILYVVELIIP